MDYPSIQISYNTSDNDIDTEFYLPCLKWANRFDRGVGYFTSGWIEKNSIGLSQFISRGGTVRWITSPILERTDYEIIYSIINEEERQNFVEELCVQSINKIKIELQENIINAFAWMVHDNVLEMKFAVPINKLDGDFHTKFGMFYGADDSIIAFEGSNNDSLKGFSNYESFMVFMSWNGMKDYTEIECKKFQVLWEGKDNNLRVYSMADALKEEIFELRNNERPYDLEKLQCKAERERWKHQEEAMEIFLKEHHGILAMATGTGKTYTAIKIIKRLFNQEEINRVVIIAYGNDLLQQWYSELLKEFHNVKIFRFFLRYKEIQKFILAKDKSILILSREASRIEECLYSLEKYDGLARAAKRTLLLFDEIHGLGAPKLRETLKGKFQNYTFRLGLSATPERDYDKDGNEFIKNEIGDIIYRFGLKEAIERGVLCPFSYFPVYYDLTAEEKTKKKKIIAAYEIKRKKGIKFDESNLYRDLARVNKTATKKIVLFEEIIIMNPELLKRCIVFVETREYGLKLQEMLIHHMYCFHTYYSEDTKDNLKKFAEEEIDCLITCKKISEGIDIKSVKHIVLFSSDRGKIVTIQRVGRSLRKNPKEQNKEALIVDFIFKDTEDTTLDRERMEWLSSLAKVREKK